MAKKLLDYKILGIIIVIVIIAGIVLFSPQITQITLPTTTTPSPTPTVTTPSPTPTPTTPPAPVIATGDLIIAVKDVKQKVAGLGYCNALTLTVDSLEIHKTGGAWITISNDTKTFDLIKYTDIVGIIGEKTLDEGKYTQIRMNIVNATVKIYNAAGGVYNKTYPMVIPSNELKVVHPFNMTADKTLALTIDFDVPNTVSRTAEGYTLKPVVTVTEETLEKGEKPTNSVEIE